MHEGGQPMPIREAARRLGIKPDRLRDWSDKGIIRAVRTPTGQRLFDPLEVERLRRAMYGEPEVTTEAE